MNSPTHSTVLPGVFYTLAAAVGFALSLVMARLSYEHGTNPSSVMLLRFVAMVPVLVVWNRLRTRPLKLSGANLRGSIVCGFLYFAGIFSYLSSVAWLPVSLSVLIFYTFPIIVALASAIIYRQRLSALNLLALVTAFAGLMMALDVSVSEFSSIGLVFAVTAPVAIAANIICSSMLLKRVTSSVFTTYTAAVSAVLAALVVFLGDGLQLPSGLAGWGSFSVMLFGFFVGFICTFNAISHLGSSRFAALMNLEPVSTIVFAVVILGEVLSNFQLLGAFIVIFGVALTQYANLKNGNRVAD